MWICLTPDLELKRYDLNVQEHMLVGRNIAFPVNQAPYIYAFDPVTPTAIRGYKRQAKVMAGVLGDAEVVEVTESPWIIAEPKHAKFGDEISEDVVNDAESFVKLGLRGVALIDGERFSWSRFPRTISTSGRRIDPTVQVMHVFWATMSRTESASLNFPTPLG